MKSNYLKPLFAFLILAITTSAHSANTNQVTTYRAQQEAAAKAAASKAAASTTTKSNTTAVMSTMSKTTTTSVVRSQLATPKTISSTTIGPSATSAVKFSDKTLRNKNITHSSADGGNGSQAVTNTGGPSDSGSYVTTSPTAQ
jgi:hypothetical protein